MKKNCYCVPSGVHSLNSLIQNWVLDLEPSWGMKLWPSKHSAIATRCEFLSFRYHRFERFSCVWSHAWHGTSTVHAIYGLIGIPSAILALAAIGVVELRTEANDALLRWKKAAVRCWAQIEKCNFTEISWLLPTLVAEPCAPGFCWCRGRVYFLVLELVPAETYGILCGSSRLAA